MLRGDSTVLKCSRRPGADGSRRFATAVARHPPRCTGAPPRCAPGKHHQPGHTANVKNGRVKELLPGCATLEGQSQLVPRVHPLCSRAIGGSHRHATVTSVRANEPHLIPLHPDRDRLADQTIFENDGEGRPGIAAIVCPIVLVYDRMHRCRRRRWWWFRRRLHRHYNNDARRSLISIAVCLGRSKSE